MEGRIEQLQSIFLWVLGICVFMFLVGIVMMFTSRNYGNTVKAGELLCKIFGAIGVIDLIPLTYILIGRLIVWVVEG